MATTDPGEPLDSREQGTSTSSLEDKCKARGRRLKLSSRQKCIDDGDERCYVRRMCRWRLNGGSEHQELMQIKEDICAPVELWKKLHRYQRTGVRWLVDLYKEAIGGILGDEMGLGKTLQIITFLVCVSLSDLRMAGFSYSGLGPVLIVCPSTLIAHWVEQFHRWWPPMRVAVMHESGSHRGSKSKLIRTITSRKNAVLITSYTMVTRLIEQFLLFDWHMIILDEGHCIRNPSAKWTVSVKQFRTPFRYIVTGSPMQNSLKELWSLFDFIYPGLLSDLINFTAEVALPITQGGYANASQLQIKTAYRCAQLLRAKISPYMLRRLKSEVKSDVELPMKSDHVLFCQLTKEQKELYLEYLASDECARMIRGDAQLFVGLVHLRQLCNHPDLITKRYTRQLGSAHSSYGHWIRSGKMTVLKSVLKLWKEQNHRVVIFSQSRLMLSILETFLQSEGYAYARLDGGTPVARRFGIVQTFNSTTSIFVMLATTRVGGLGLDMTGADRVLLYDPDWNPSTDVQAQERAWRLGQKNDVLVFRLISSNTVEEKIYQRQIFKQLLINRILKNPRQGKFFKGLKVADLFSFVDTEQAETRAMFKDVESVKRDLLKQVMAKKSVLETKETKVKLSKEKVQRLMERAKQLSKAMSKQAAKAIDVPMLRGESVVEYETSCEQPNGHSSTTDDYVLKKLLGIDSALSHDHVVDFTQFDETDPMFAEADRIAHRAIVALNSNPHGFDEGSAVPKSLSSADLLAANPFCHSSSSTKEECQRYTGNSLLEIISRRKSLCSESALSKVEATPSRIRPVDTAPEAFRSMPCRFAKMASGIRLFLNERGGQATTAAIHDQFQAHIPDSDAAVFRSLLKRLCTFRRLGDGQGLWCLRKTPQIS